MFCCATSKTTTPFIMCLRPARRKLNHLKLRSSGLLRLFEIVRKAAYLWYRSLLARLQCKIETRYEVLCAHI
jgi:hypothetical protein